MGIKIVGTGSYVSETVLDNEQLSKIVETNDEWIKTRTGISTRHISVSEPTWYMGVKAAEDALNNANIRPNEIDMIIDSTITSDFVTPSVSCIIQKEIHAENAACMDVNAACSGFIYALDTAMRYLATEPSYNYILVVANEKLSTITDYTDRGTCVLFGDSAAAVVVTRSDNLYYSFLGADGNGGQYLYCYDIKNDIPFKKDENSQNDILPFEKTDSTFVVQNGKEVYKFATSIMPYAVNKVLNKGDINIDSVDYIVPHQANIRIIETAAKHLDFSMKKMIVNLDKYGNTSSASIPLAFDEAVKSGKIKHGMRICFVGFGAGLTYGAILFDY